MSRLQYNFKEANEVILPQTFFIEVFSEDFCKKKLNGSQGSNFIQVDGVDIVSQNQYFYGKGLNIAIIDQNNGKLNDFKTFNTGELLNDEIEDQKNRKELYEFIEGVSEGKIIALTTIDDFVCKLYKKFDKNENEKIDQLFRTLGSRFYFNFNPYLEKNESNIINVPSFRSGWSLVTVKGKSKALCESYEPRVINPENPINSRDHAKTKVSGSWESLDHGALQDYFGENIEGYGLYLVLLCDKIRLSNYFKMILDSISVAGLKDHCQKIIKSIIHARSFKDILTIVFKEYSDHCADLLMLSNLEKTLSQETVESFMINLKPRLFEGLGDAAKQKIESSQIVTQTKLKYIKTSTIRPSTMHQTAFSYELHNILDQILSQYNVISQLSYIRLIKEMKSSQHLIQNLKDLFQGTSEYELVDRFQYILEEIKKQGTDEFKICQKIILNILEPVKIERHETERLVIKVSGPNHLALSTVISEIDSYLKKYPEYGRDSFQGLPETDEERESYSHFLLPQNISNGELTERGIYLFRSYDGNLRAKIRHENDLIDEINLTELSKSEKEIQELLSNLEWPTRKKKVSLDSKLINYIFDLCKGVRDIYIDIPGLLYLDCDFKIPGKNIIINAHNVYVKKSSTIDLSGRNGREFLHNALSGEEIRKANNAADVECNGRSGKNGLSGAAGESSGNLIINTTVINEDEHELTIIVNGGNGANGQNGGDGEKGKDGTDGKDGEPKNEKSFFHLRSRVYVVHSTLPSPGGDGGDGGAPGLGGEGGHAGKVKIEGKETANGSAGKPGKCASNGMGAHGGVGGKYALDFVCHHVSIFWSNHKSGKYFKPEHTNHEAGAYRIEITKPWWALFVPQEYLKLPKNEDHEIATKNRKRAETGKDGGVSENTNADKNTNLAKKNEIIPLNLSNGIQYNELEHELNNFAEIRNEIEKDLANAKNEVDNKNITREKVGTETLVRFKSSELFSEIPKHISDQIYGIEDKSNPIKNNVIRNLFDEYKNIHGLDRCIIFERLLVKIEYNVRNSLKHEFISLIKNITEKKDKDELDLILEIINNDVTLINHLYQNYTIKDVKFTLAMSDCDIDNLPELFLHFRERNLTLKDLMELQYTVRRIKNDNIKIKFNKLLEEQYLKDKCSYQLYAQIKRELVAVGITKADSLHLESLLEFNRFFVEGNNKRNLSPSSSRFFKKFYQELRVYKDSTSWIPKYRDFQLNKITIDQEIKDKICDLIEEIKNKFVKSNNSDILSKMKFMMNLDLKNISNLREKFNVVLLFLPHIHLDVKEKENILKNIEYILSDVNSEISNELLEYLNKIKFILSPKIVTEESLPKDVSEKIKKLIETRHEFDDTNELQETINNLKIAEPQLFKLLKNSFPDRWIYYLLHAELYNEILVFYNNVNKDQGALSELPSEISDSLFIFIEAPSMLMVLLEKIQQEITLVNELGRYSLQDFLIVLGKRNQEYFLNQETALYLSQIPISQWTVFFEKMNLLKKLPNLTENPKLQLIMFELIGDLFNKFDKRIVTEYIRIISKITNPDYSNIISLSHCLIRYESLFTLENLFLLENHPQEEWKLCLDTEKNKFYNDGDILPTRKIIENLGLEINLHEIGEFKTKLLKTLSKIKNPEFKAKNFKYIVKPISQWDRNDIRELWVSHVAECKKDDKNWVQNHLTEVIAVVRRAVKITYDYEPHDTQLLSLLLYMDANNKGQGRLGQVPTGEGKTLTTAMLAIVLGLIGPPVNIITSSLVLAEQNIDDTRELYECFKITVSNNCDKIAQDNLKERMIRYDSAIVYGDVGSFQRDKLLANLDKNILEKRQNEFLIVDEVDNMLLDKGDNTLYLSHEMIDFRHLRHLYVEIWTAVNSPDINEYEEVEFSEIVENIIQGKIDDKNINIPEYLIDFIKYRLPIWINHAIYARKLQENKQYINEKNGIIIMDNDTGVEQLNMQWNNGLHQFLQLMKLQKFSSESLKANFQSNFNYFQSYIGKIYGITGTLGSDTDKKLFNQLYQVDFFNMPRFKKHRFYEDEGIVVNSEKKWLNEIINDVKNNSKRPILIICETIDDVEKVKCRIEEEKIHDRLHIYSKSSQKLTVGDHACPLEPGDIIVATNLAARGANFTTSTNTEQSGGLYAILSYMPPNIRIERQVFGRTARQGNKGSGRCIVFDKKFTDINELRRNRDWEAMQRAEYVRTKTLQFIHIENALYKKFLSTYAEIKKMLISGRSDQYGKDYVELQLKSLEDRWAFWLDEQDQCIQNSTRQNLESLYSAYLEFHTKMLKIAGEDNLYKFIDSPHELIALGRCCYIHKKQDSALSCFEKATILYPYHSEIAYHWQARILSEKTNASNNRAAIKRALKCELQLVEHRMSDDLIPAVTALNAAIAFNKQEGKGQAKNNFEDQIKSELALYHVQLSAIRNIIGRPLTQDMFNKSLTDDAQRTELYDKLLQKSEFVKGYRLNKKIEIKLIGEEKQISLLTPLGHKVLRLETSVIDHIEKMLAHASQLDDAGTKSISVSKESFTDLTLINKAFSHQESLDLIWNNLINIGIIKTHKMSCSSKDGKKEEKLEAINSWVKTEVSSILACEYIVVCDDKPTVEDLAKVKVGKAVLFEKKGEVFTIHFLDAEKIYRNRILKNSSDSKYQLLPSNKTSTYRLTNSKPTKKENRRINKEKLVLFESINNEQFIIHFNFEGREYRNRTVTAPEQVSLIRQVFHENEADKFDISDEDVLKQFKAIGFYFGVRLHKEDLNEILHPKNCLPGVLKLIHAITNSLSNMRYSVINGIYATNKKVSGLESLKDCAKKNRIVITHLDDINTLKKVASLNGCGLEAIIVEQSESVNKVLEYHIGQLKVFPKFNASVQDLRNYFLNGECPKEIFQFSSWYFDDVLVFERTISRWNWNAFAVAMLGVVQIALGIALEVYTIGFASQLGAMLIAEGISDLIYSAQAGITGQFSWKDYGRHKAISVAMLATTVGFLGVGAVVNGGFAALSSGFNKTGISALTEVFVYAGKRVALEVGKSAGAKMAEIGLSQVCYHLPNEIQRLLGEKIHKGLSESNVVLEKKKQLQKTMSMVFQITDPIKAQQIIENTIADTLRDTQDNTIFNRIVETAFSLATEIPKSLLLTSNNMKNFAIGALISVIVGGIETTYKFSRLIFMAPTIYEALNKKLLAQVNQFKASDLNDIKNTLSKENGAYIEEQLSQTSHTITSIIIKKSMDEILKPNLMGMTQKALHSLTNNLQRKNQASLQAIQSRKLNLAMKSSIKNRIGTASRVQKAPLENKPLPPSVETRQGRFARDTPVTRARNLIDLERKLPSRNRGRIEIDLNQRKSILVTTSKNVNFSGNIDRFKLIPSEISSEIRTILMKHSFVLARNLFIDQINAYCKLKENLIKEKLRKFQFEHHDLMKSSREQEKKLIILMIGLILIEKKIIIETDSLMVMSHEERKEYKPSEINIEEVRAQALKLCEACLLEKEEKKRINIVKVYLGSTQSDHYNIIDQLNILNQFFLNYDNGENKMRQFEGQNQGGAIVKPEKFSAAQHWSEIGGTVIKEGLSSFKDFMGEAQIANLVSNESVSEVSFVAITAFKEISKCMMFSIQANLKIYDNIRSIAQGVLAQQESFQRTLLAIQKQKTDLLESVRASLNTDREKSVLELVELTLKFNNDIVSITSFSQSLFEKKEEIYNKAKNAGRDKLNDLELAQIQDIEKNIELRSKDKDRALDAYNTQVKAYENLQTANKDVKIAFIDAMSKDNGQVNQFIREAYAQNSENIRSCLDLSKQILNANLSIASKAIDAISGRSKKQPPSIEPSKNPSLPSNDQAVQAKCFSKPRIKTETFFQAIGEFKASDEEKALTLSDERFKKNRNNKIKEAILPFDIKKGDRFKIKLFSNEVLLENSWVKARREDSKEKGLVPTNFLQLVNK